MKGSAAVKPAIDCSEIEALLKLSSRIGCDPLLTQASSGNTSLKMDGTLWVKASGKWLAEADRDEILVPVDLAECLQSFRRGDRFPLLHRRAGVAPLRPSVETFMHSVLPHRVVVHVHSVNTIAWAVRHDAPLQLAIKLSGLNWCWIPYVNSGFSLAREIQLRSRRDSTPKIFVLANHGLVVCGDDCRGVESLLLEVERRLATEPRVVPQANFGALEQVQRIPGWCLPEEKTIHTLGTDGNSRRVVVGGILYPCQAVMLGGILPILMRGVSFSRAKRKVVRFGTWSPVLIVERCGVLVREDMTPDQFAALRGYVEIVRRIETSAPIRYLTSLEIKNLLRPAGRGIELSTGADQATPVGSI